MSSILFYSLFYSIVSVHRGGGEYSLDRDDVCDQSGSDAAGSNVLFRESGLVSGLSGHPARLR